MKGAWEEKFPPSVDSVSCIGVNSTPQRSVNPAESLFIDSSSSNLASKSQCFETLEIDDRR